MSYAKLLFTDLDGIPRGKYIAEQKVKKSTSMGFCDVVFGWDLKDSCYPIDSVTGWDRGFPDGLLTIDTDTERTINEPGAASLYLADFQKDPILASVCPRSLLKQVLGEYQELGLFVKAGFEYEWFNFCKNSDTISSPQTNTLTNGMYGYSLRRLSENQLYVDDLLSSLAKMDIQLEGFHTETGPGVYEAAIICSNGLSAADNAVIFKSEVKRIAAKHQILASFMAKWDTDLPGCGGHIHLSLEDQKGAEVFSFTKNKMNAISQHFLAGVLEGMIPLMPLYCPTINSYKRLRSGSWAPTCQSWGYQNRTTAVRIITEKPLKHHLEMRIPGADCNPYLALYALLSSGLYGIRQNSSLGTGPCEGNAYDSKEYKLLPGTLQDAIAQMKSDPVTPKLVDSRFVDHFVKTRNWEIHQFQQSVTNWEIDRYLEII